MSSTHDYNTRGKEMSDSKILVEISKFREELVENFYKGLTNIKDETINLKEVVIKNLQNQNKRLDDVVNQWQEKITSLESKSNSVEQHGRQNNMEINGIPNSISDGNIKSTVINVLSKATNVHVTADDIEARHRIGKSNGNSKKTIVCFINRKYCKCALVNRKKLKSFNSESIALPNVKLYFNENLTEYNNTLAFYGRKLIRAGLINNTCTLNCTVQLRTVGERPIKVFHMSKLLELYLNFEFYSNDGNVLVDALGDASIQSSF